MRKLFIGISAVALLSLLAVPAMATQLDYTEDLLVEITVQPYGAIILDSTVYLTVTEAWLDGAGSTQNGEKSFTVLCNVNSLLTVTAPETSQAKNAPGANLYYPVATYTDTADVDHKIGFGVTLYNTKTPAQMAWDDDFYQRKAYVSFAPGDTPLNLADDNARVMITSATDSSRGEDALAPAGVYETYLILTLITT